VYEHQGRYWRIWSSPVRSLTVPVHGMMALTPQQATFPDPRQWRSGRGLCTAGSTTGLSTSTSSTLEPTAPGLPQHHEKEHPASADPEVSSPLGAPPGSSPTPAAAARSRAAAARSPAAPGWLVGPRYLVLGQGRYLVLGGERPLFRPLGSELTVPIIEPHRMQIRHRHSHLDLPVSPRAEGATSTRGVSRQPDAQDPPVRDSAPTPPPFVSQSELPGNHQSNRVSA